MQIKILDKETGEIETINNVVGMWNEDSTIEYLENGEAVFHHIQPQEQIIQC